jgi:hypothetical protein
MLFNDFTDDLTFQKRTGTDSFECPIYAEEVIVKGRLCKQANVFDMTSERVATDLRYLYHVPMEVDVAADDLLDSKVVKEVHKIRGIDNVYRFKKVVCK